MNFKSLIFIFAGLILALQPSTSFSQQSEKYSFSFRMMDLDQALQDFQVLTGINLVYDSRLTQNIRVNGSIQNRKPHEIMERLLRDTNLDWRQLESGTFLIYWSPRSRLQAGTLYGVITDQETNEPIAGVNILVGDRQLGASTNRNGQFQISGIPPDTYSISISHVAYQTIVVEKRIQTGSWVRLNTSLELQSVEFEQVVVVDRNWPLFTMVSGADITDIEGFTLPTQFGPPDALRNLSFTSGVQFQSPLADITLQGATNQNHLLLLDGTPVFSPVSMARHLSIFSPYAIRRLTVYKAGYHTSAGSSTTGLINAEQVFPAYTEDNTLVQMDVASINTRFLNKVDIAGYPVQFMVALRSHTPWISEFSGVHNHLTNKNILDFPLLSLHTDTFQTSDSETDTWSRSQRVRFYDLHLSASLQSRDLSRTSLSFFNGGNRLQTGLNSAPENAINLNLNERYTWDNTIASIQHSRMLTDITNLTITGRYSYHNQTTNYTGTSQPSIVLFNENNRNTIHHLSTDTRISLHLSDNMELRSGLTLTKQNFDSQFDHPLAAPIAVKNTQQSASAYSEILYQTGDGWTGLIGNRLTWVNQNLPYFEPRFSIGKKIETSLIGPFSFNFSTGLYRDLIQFISWTNFAPNAVLNSSNYWISVRNSNQLPKAWHVAAELRTEPVNGYSFGFEPYYKLQSKSTHIDYDAFITAEETGATFSDLLTSSNSYMVGFGLSNRYQYNSGFFHLLYNFSHTKIKIDNRFENAFLNPYNHIPHQIIASAGRNLSDHWFLLVQWDFRFGQEGWAYRRSYYDLVFPSNPDEFTTEQWPKSTTRPRFAQLDVSLQGSYTFWNIDWQFKFDLINALNSNHFYDQGFENGNTFNQIYRREFSSFQPSFSIQASF